jgi:hypothetical protein
MPSQHTRRGRSEGEESQTKNGRQAKGPQAESRLVDSGAPISGDAATADLASATFEQHVIMLGGTLRGTPGEAHQRAEIVQRLQQSHGNQYVQRVVKQAASESKTESADRTSDVARLRSMSQEHRAAAVNELQRTYGNQRVQRILKQSEESSQDELDSDTASRIEGARGSGATLDPTLQTDMETAFDQSFQDVRIHTGHEAGELNDAVQARAFTVGNDIFFGKGNYSPSSSDGKELIAHELTHVVQQGGAPSTSTAPSQVSSPNDAAEIEAARIAETVVRDAELARQPVDEEEELLTARQGVEEEEELTAARQPQTPPSGATPAAVTSFLPPPELQSGMMPRDAQIVTLDTRPLYDAIAGAKWPEQTRSDPGWAGWTVISNLTSQDFWIANLPNATTGGGIRQDLPSQIGAMADLVSSLQIRARIISVDFEAADRVGISQSSGGGASVGSSGTAGQSTSLGYSAGAKMSTSGGPEVSGGVSGQMGTSSGRTGQGGWQGTASAGTAATAGVRFRFDVLWDVTIRQELDVGTFTSVATLGLGPLVAYAMENPVQQVQALAGGIVRFPEVRCEATN